jgi:protein TonB
LSVFDLPLPPVPPEDPPPPPAEVKTKSAPSGGSPGIARQRPSERVVTPDVAPATVDVTPVPEAPPIPSQATGGAAPIGNEGAGSSGIGSGSGAHTGTGAGDGGEGVSVVSLGRAGWITRPTRADLLREWPFRGRNSSAQVVLSCRVRRGGRPYDCSVVQEVPSGLGFGRAAIRLAYRSRIKPVQRNGQDWYDLPISVPFRFTRHAKPAPPPVSEAAPAPSP